MGEEEILDGLVGHSLTVAGSSTSFGHLMVLIVVNTLTSILGTLGNILVCVTVYKTSSLRNNFGFFICSLALADFLVTFTVQPTPVFTLIRNEIQHNLVPLTLNLATEILTVVSCTASLGSLWFLSMDRCLCILSSVRYRTLVTKPRVKAAIVFIWLAASFSVARYFWSFITPETFRVVSFVALILCYAVMCLCYALVFWKIRRQARIRRRMRPGMSQAWVAKEAEKREAEKREGNTSTGVSDATGKKLAKTIALVVGVFTLAWAPLVFSSKDDVSQAVVLWAVTVGFCNSSVNPVIYCYRSQECRNAFWKLVSRYCRPTGSRVGTSNLTKTRNEVPVEIIDER